ncbi:MAG: cation transporter [Bacteroidetes bacterium]|nr:cation transporter [Bacteroidota bacterium]
MTHTYNITGMTCNSCVAKVKSELLKLGEITSADVQLQAPQATISMSKHISTETLQKAISHAGTKYIISAADTGMHHDSAAVADETTTNSYFPIFLIFGYITGISLIIQIFNDHFYLGQWMSHFMAGFFLVFSFFKIMNLKGFAEGYGTYDVIAKKIAAYGFVYPFIELGLGIAYLTEFNPLITNSLTLVVMGISTIGVIQSLMKKTPFQCACLGTVIKLPLSKVTLFEDLLMVGMSVVMLIMLIAN